MTTNVTPPEVRINLRNTTVRGLLNRIAAYSLTTAAAQNSLGASGWEFSFRVDANGPTGLGGYPSWAAF